MTTDVIISPDRRFARPLKTALLFSILGEATIFVVWGLILFPDGSVFYKFMWTIVFCGLGMGGAFGAVVALGLLDRMSGWPAVLVTGLISSIMLGIFCNTLCLRLDMIFGFFGAQGSGGLFLVNDIAMAAVGGLLVGWLTFTERGRDFGPAWLK